MKHFILAFITVVSVTFAQHSHHHGNSPVSCSKPSGYVTMEYEHTSLEVNQSIDTTVTIISEMDTKIIDYQVVVDEKLELLQLHKQKQEQNNYDRVVIKLQTLALEKGDYFVTIYTQTVTMNEPKDIRYKSLLVPIQIGHTTVRKTRSRSDEEKLKIYQGMERVR